MALLLSKRKETYYTYQLNNNEREFLINLLCGMCGMKEVIKDDETYFENIKELLGVLAEE
ncbi:hypothetical protein [uncultured Metabacillus sp.]|uniref:hypothetical protein n=1 Tax=uncultured Metabacillus sp. TaxID=2860135 RepID=UPI002607906E|nr:hypothetical protein [uncultured Metabacillus sp.]